MKILFVSATLLELRPLMDVAVPDGDNKFSITSQSGDTLEVLITGVGLVSMATNLSLHLAKNNYDLVLNVGVAGAFNRQFPLGSLWQVSRDYLADLGVEMGQKFISMNQLGLSSESDILLFPRMEKHSDLLKDLPMAIGVSKNTGSGRVSTIAYMQRQYKAEVESMEGAAFFYVCSKFECQFAQLRAISNYVGERDKRKWDLKGSVTVLNEFLLKSFIENS